MKRIALTSLIVLLLLGATVAVVWADKPTGFDANGNEIAWERSSATQSCARIQDGSLSYSSGHYLAGQPLQMGYDAWGYNYQAHQFNGLYCNVYLGGYGYPPYEGDAEAYLAENPTAESIWCWPDRDVELVMKWSDEWLANTDCDGDGKLDRHYGHATYIGSGAWETNHQSGTYALDDGTTCHWTYFVKIIAAPDGAYVDDPYFTDEYGITHGTYYTADGTEIGFEEWGSFAVIQQVYNDPCGGYHGIEYLSPDHAGFGGW